MNWTSFLLHYYRFSSLIHLDASFGIICFSGKLSFLLDSVYSYLTLKTIINKGKLAQLFLILRLGLQTK